MLKSFQFLFGNDIICYVFLMQLFLSCNKAFNTTNSNVHTSHSTFRFVENRFFHYRCGMCT